MALHNKYRPINFDTLMGNKHIVSSIAAQAKKSPKERMHTYFFTGPTGTGKTTIARIMAKEFGAMVEEINTSEDNGVDFARSLVQRIQYKGFDGDKLYILDECHRLTTDAQNILLKVLEEPPIHAYIVLCSTDPQKVIKTVVNRTLRLETSKPNSAELFDLLDDIATLEKIPIVDGLLDVIIEQSDGVPRDAVTMLESVVGVEKDQQVDSIRRGKSEEGDVINLCRVLLNNPKWKDVASILKVLDVQPDKIRLAVIGYMSKVLLGGTRNMQAFAVLYEFENLGFGCSMASIIKATFRVCTD